jgi:hypothetical protein
MRHSVALKGNREISAQKPRLPGAAEFLFSRRTTAAMAIRCLAHCAIDQYATAIFNSAVLLLSWQKLKTARLLQPYTKP